MEIRSSQTTKRSEKVKDTNIGNHKKEKIKAKTSKNSSNNNSSKVLSKVNDVLVEAIKAYDGPEIILTSGLRHSGYKRSLHRIGKAIDIHFCEEFVMWCELDAGKEWLKKYNLEFFVEDNREREFDDNLIDKHFRKIP